jgi:hypothetical protein
MEPGVELTLLAKLAQSTPSKAMNVSASHVPNTRTPQQTHNPRRAAHVMPDTPDLLEDHVKILTSVHPMEAEVLVLTYARIRTVVMSVTVLSQGTSSTLWIRILVFLTRLVVT